MKPDDLFAHVDPDLLAPLKAMRTIEFNQRTLDKVRAQAPPQPAASPFERFIPGPAGAPPVRVLVIDPHPGGRDRPALLHIHGGGFVTGAASATNPTVKAASEILGCVVVSVDYRLAPETAFPGALEDCYAALRWMHDHAGELGIDRRRIAVGGESAGGGHAACLTLAARDRGEFAIAYQLLIYPMLDDRTGIDRPAAPQVGRFIWTAASNRFGWSAMLGTAAGAAQAPAGAVPARAENLAGLPPAFIGVGGLDLFVQEDIDYAGRLIAAGVPVELHVTPGAYHGFDAFAAKAPSAIAFRKRWVDALRRGLQVPI